MVEKEKTHNSYAAKFLVKKGISSLLPQQSVNKEPLQDYTQSQNEAQSSHYYNTPFHEFTQRTTKMKGNAFYEMYFIKFC